MLNEGVDIPDVDFIVFFEGNLIVVSIFFNNWEEGYVTKKGKTLIVEDFVADVRRIKRLQSFQDEFKEVRKNEIEDLYINDGFSISFTSELTSNFLDLVARDISEESEENDEVYFSID